MCSRLMAVIPCLAVLGCSTTETGWGSGVQGRKGTITLPTYAWGPDDVNPHFPCTHGRPIYPYPMQDNLDRTKVDRTYRTLELENEYLCVMVIPELGGHIYSVLDKTVNRPMFYVNKVIKPSLIGMRGAWISGGVELNTGPQVHTVTTVSPVPCRLVEHADGSRTIAIRNLEQVFRTEWLVEVTLRPGRSFMEQHIRFFNPTPYVHPYYFWHNAAVPNTPQMQFIYPMTLGMDHYGTTFFRWPIDKGVDLTWLKNYRAPTSIFAYRCDQDFFGRYDHEADHGLVAYANHFEVPGKKAWTWGLSGDGVVPQTALTDDGSLYNEIQTGPLATQSDFGVLSPHETVEWSEWWYPVHGTGGYDFATRDVAVKIVTGGDSAAGVAAIKLIGTGTWNRAVCRLTKEGRPAVERAVSVSPRQPTVVPFDGLPAGGLPPPFTVEVVADRRTLARFTYPLPLPVHEPPDLAPLQNPMKTARDRWAAGVAADKLSKADEAHKEYGKAVELQPDFAPAHLNLAILDLKCGLPQDARGHLEAILLRDNDNGLAHYYLAQALLDLGEETGALEHAWLAARDPAADSIGLGLAGEIYIRLQRWSEAIGVLRQAVTRDIRDSRNRSLLAFAFRSAGQIPESRALVRYVLLLNDPMDPLAEWLAAAGDGRSDIRTSAICRRLLEEPQTVLEMAALCYRLKAYAFGLELLLSTSLAKGGTATPISFYYAAVFADQLGRRDEANQFLDQAVRLSPDYVFPHRLETVAVLRRAADLRPNDWHIHYYLGCLYLAKYRKEEAVAAWNKAVSLHDQYSVVHRNLGTVLWKLDNNVQAAIPHFEKALVCRPDDQTLYRDLAALYQQTEQWEKARQLLEKTLPFERYRSDVVESLARTYQHFGQNAEAAKLVDSHTFDVWEGQDSVHRIFTGVHLALGKAALQAGHLPEAEAEFRRALEYPPNLRVGRPAKPVEAEQYFWLGKALSAAGKTADARAAWQRAVDEGSKTPGDYPEQASKALKELGQK
jgi:tetratricopeptide (TPR) repeat protein